MENYFDKDDRVFIKLYKQIEDDTLYWETWNQSNIKATIHWGFVGDFGESIEIKTNKLNELKFKINKEINLKKSEGFEEIPEEDHYTVVISFKLNSWGSSKDLERREELRNIITGSLGWTGNGRCDDGDIGNYEMNLYADVVSPYFAIEAISLDFKEYGIKDEHTFMIMKGEEIIRDSYKPDY